MKKKKFNKVRYIMIGEAGGFVTTDQARVQTTAMNQAASQNQANASAQIAPKNLAISADILLKHTLPMILTTVQGTQGVSVSQPGLVNQQQGMESFYGFNDSQDELLEFSLLGTVKSAFNGFKNTVSNAEQDYNNDRGVTQQAIKNSPTNIKLVLERLNVVTMQGFSFADAMLSSNWYLAACILNMALLPLMQDVNYKMNYTPAQLNSAQIFMKFVKEIALLCGLGYVLLVVIKGMIVTWNQMIAKINNPIYKAACNNLLLLFDSTVGQKLQKNL